MHPPFEFPFVVFHFEHSHRIGKNNIQTNFQIYRYNVPQSAYVNRKTLSLLAAAQHRVIFQGIFSNALQPHTYTPPSTTNALLCGAQRGSLVTRKHITLVKHQKHFGVARGRFYKHNIFIHQAHSLQIVRDHKVISVETFSTPQTTTILQRIPHTHTHTRDVLCGILVAQECELYILHYIVLDCTCL